MNFKYPNWADYIKYSSSVVQCVLCEMVIQTSEVASLKRDVDKQKEQLSAAEIKIKWNQNKLKTEQDAHKVCGSSLAQSQIEIVDSNYCLYFRLVY